MRRSVKRKNTLSFSPLPCSDNCGDDCCGSGSGVVLAGSDVVL